MRLPNIFKPKRTRSRRWALYAHEMCASAIEYAREFDKHLDFSETSIADLEEILEWYCSDIADSHPTDNQIWSVSIIFGSYLGETLLRNGLRQKGFAWDGDVLSDVPLLAKDDGSHLTPLDKVYKRLTNGAEDSILSFYRFAMTKI